jgi:SSS family solute:Na+ symporter/sodium/proline symporter
MIYFILGYVILLFAVAIWKSIQVKTQDDFMVAGRSVPTYLLIGTLVCTWIGSGSLFGGAGLAFRNGISELWMSAGAWVGIVLIFFLAPKVRALAEYTVSDILEKRYNLQARILGTVAVIIAYMSIVGYQFRGGGRLLEILTDGQMTATQGALITMVVTIVFTLLAGMLSIVAIDLFNGIMMTLGVLIALPLLLGNFGGSIVGGINKVVETLPQEHFTVFGRHNFWWAMGVFFPTFFLLLGESSMYQKFFSAKNEKAARNAVIGMVIGVVIIETALCLVAVVGSAIYHGAETFMVDGVISAPLTECIILKVAQEKLPLLAGSLLMAAAVAIILSTANTFLMIPSTNITRDIYQRLINPKASNKTIVWIQRVFIVILGISAYIVATYFKTILDMAFYAYTMVGAGITPALLAAFLWKRATPKGGAASIAVGIITTMIAATFMSSEYIIYPAAIASILTLIIVSLCTRDKEKKYLQFFPDTNETTEQEEVQETTEQEEIQETNE